MVSTEQILQIIYTGIKRYEKPYGVPAERIQVIFQLSERKEVTYTTCIDNQDKEEMKLSDFIGFNTYNFMVGMHIKRLLIKFAGQNQVEPTDINMLAGIKAGDHVYVTLRNKKELIRVITNLDELRK